MRTAINSLLLASLAATPGVFGSSAASDPAGFTRQEIAQGRQTVGVTLNHAPVCSALIAANEGSILLLDPAAAVIGDSLEAGHSYYVEIAAGSNDTFAGDRFEVDVAATRACGDSIVVIKAGAATTTATAPLPVDSLAGHRAILRRHVTISDVFGAAEQTAFAASSDHSTADKLLFFDRATGGFSTYYVSLNERTGAKEWRRVGTVGSMNETIIAPGTGLFVERVSGVSIDLVVFGSVRTNDFIMPLSAGYNFITSPYPTEDSPGRLHMTSLNGFQASTIANDADQILVFNDAGYDTYFLHSGADGSGDDWRKTGDDTAHFTTAKLLSHRGSVFVRKVAADPDFLARCASL